MKSQIRMTAATDWALRRLGVRVAVVTQLHPSDFVLLDELTSEGVQTFATAAPVTSGIENIYNST